MYCFFVEKQQVQDGVISVRGSDVNHIRNVLRMKPGEQIQVRDSDGMGYVCRILELSREWVKAEIQGEVEDQTELGAHIVLYQGLPKSDKMDLIVQKAVELGVAEVVPVVTRRTIVKLDAKKEEARIRRWTSIAEGAAKQAGRSVVPKIRAVCPLEAALREAEALSCCLIPYEKEPGMASLKSCIERIQLGQSIGIFIGPEGGFEEEEVRMAKEQHGAVPVSLGKRILRTETAGLTLLSILMYHLESE